VGRRLGAADVDVDDDDDDGCDLLVTEDVRRTTNSSPTTAEAAGVPSACD